MEGELETLLQQNIPVIIVLDSVDPFCHRIADFFDGFHIPADKICKSYVDRQGEKGEHIAKASKQKSRAYTARSGGEEEDLELPHVYLGGQFFYGGQQLRDLPQKSIVKNKLVEIGALTLRKLADVQEMITKNKMVVFLNEFSPFSLSVKDIIDGVVKTSVSKDVNFIYVDKINGGSDIQEAAQYIAKAESVPIVFVDGQFLGSATEMEAMSKDFTLFDKLAKSGFVRKPDHDKLSRFKKDFKIFMVGNDYSAFCLEARNALENIQIPAGCLCIEDSSSSARDDLENAARIDTKEKNAPFLYVCGKHIPTSEFMKKIKENKLQSFLQEKGAL